MWGQVSKSTVDLQDKGGLHTFNNPIMMVQTSFCFYTYVVITPVTIHISCSTAEMAMQQEPSRSYTWILLKRLLRKLCHLSNRDNYCGHELLKCHLNQSFFFCAARSSGFTTHKLLLLQTLYIYMNFAVETQYPLNILIGYLLYI